MFGAIIGDLAGSIYEYDEFQDGLKGKINLERRKQALNNPNLIDTESFISDDTILTTAIADAILNKKDYGKTLKEYGLKYYKIEKMDKPYFKEMFSPGFVKWAKEDKIGYSIGNGSAMRVSPVAYLFDDLNKVRKEARKTAMPSHQSEEGIKGAEALASVIYLARKKKSKSEIKDFVEKDFGYKLTNDLEELMQTNIFNGTAEITVPQAISVFLQSEGFEDSIRKAIGIGGDTDTIACMVGSISEAYFGIPNEFKKAAFNKLPIAFQKIVLDFYQKQKEDVLEI